MLSITITILKKDVVEEDPMSLVTILLIVGVVFLALSGFNVLQFIYELKTKLSDRRKTTITPDNYTYMHLSF